MINLKLSIDDVNRILTVLGEQPIKSGLNDLTQNIKTQGESQLRATAAAVEPVEVVDEVAK